jgi:hypothetical protein
VSTQNFASMMNQAVPSSVPTNQGSMNYGQSLGNQGSMNYGQSQGNQGSMNYSQSQGNQGSMNYGQSQGNQGSMNYSSSANIPSSVSSGGDWGQKKRVGSGTFSALDAVLNDGNLVEVFCIFAHLLVYLLFCSHRRNQLRLLHNK